MSFGNTVKTGTGTSYWLLVDSEGRLILSPDSVGGGGSNFPLQGHLADDSDGDGSPAGVDIPTGRIAKIEAIVVSVVTTATAGTRYISMLIGHATYNTILKLQLAEITASQNWTITLAPGGAVSTAEEIGNSTGVFGALMPFPSALQLPEDTTISVEDIASVDVDDAIGLSVIYSYEVVA